MRASANVRAALLLVIACAAANGMREERRIMVGGSEGWSAGTNYNDWALQNNPFHINDTLVFKYPPPGSAAPSLYLMPDLWSFVTCDFKAAKLVGMPTEGSAEGFGFQLNRREPYYFASDDGHGYDCLAGLPKFVATPMN